MIKNWSEKYTNYKVRFDKLPKHYSWKEFFKQPEVIKELKLFNRLFSRVLECTKFSILPYPDHIFNAFLYTPLYKLKVCIIGQDPYFNTYSSDDITLPEAMGLSFSVPEVLPIPSSLHNIYKNGVAHNNLYKYPEHGNLEFWAFQGVFLFNTALTVLEGCKLAHVKLWEKFANSVIKYISDNCNNIVFVLWGSNALSKKVLIDENKHKFVISSHPSGLSCNKKLGKYPEFNKVDQLGQINKHLREYGKQEIVWHIV